MLTSASPVRHYVMDRDRVWYANRMIGMTGSPFWCLFGDPSMLGYIPLYSAMIIKMQMQELNSCPA